MVARVPRCRHAVHCQRGLLQALSGDLGRPASHLYALCRGVGFNPLAAGQLVSQHAYLACTCPLTGLFVQLSFHRIVEDAKGLRDGNVQPVAYREFAHLLQLDGCAMVSEVMSARCKNQPVHRVLTCASNASQLSSPIRLPPSLPSRLTTRASNPLICQGCARLSRPSLRSATGLLGGISGLRRSRAEGCAAVACMLAA